MIDSLTALDHQWMVWFQTHCSNEFLDGLLPLLRNKLFWLPLYVFILSYYFIHRRAKFLWFIVTVSVLVLISDQVSAGLIKPFVSRLRPCKSWDDIRQLINCGSGYSFPSAHATNHFALATFLMLRIRLDELLSSKLLIKICTYLLYIWAAVIAISQVYVGVHYFSDVIFGSLLGITLAYMVNIVAQKILKRIHNGSSTDFNY